MHEIIAIIFDFDDTLAPDSTSGYLKERCGVDTPRFWTEEVQPLMDEGWDPVPAYFYKMAQKSNSGAVPPITRDALASWGAELPLYPEVESMFGRLRDAAEKANPRVSLEFYLISCGIGEVLRRTSIAKEFKEIWASDFHYDEQGQIMFPKKIVSFTDKTRYIFHVQKGIFGREYIGKPFEVNRKVDATQLRVPMSQMIMVGDGSTDIPCFSLVKGGGGTVIGVYDADNRKEWGKAWGFVEDGRVSNLVSANYKKGSELIRFLTLAVENIAERIALAQHTYQG